MRVARSRDESRMLTLIAFHTHRKQGMGCQPYRSPSGVNNLTTSTQQPSSFQVTMLSVTSPHPLTYQVARRCQNSGLFQNMATRNSRNATTRYLELVTRWKRNFSRLYARRMLDIAIASAASYRLKTQMEAAIEKPSAWHHWQAKDWEEDALASLGKSKFSRFYMATKRLAALAVLGSPMAVLVPLSYVIPSAKDAAWAYALWGIEKAGPTWIKLVQWATTRQDLFSPEFCQYFGKLRDNTEGHSWKETARILETELGTSKEAMEFDPIPIGSGCIAQVYRGRLTKPTKKYPINTKIAIKVQHPGIWDKVCVDFYLLKKAANFLESLPRLNLEYLSMGDTIRQFRDIMLPQMDLELEAKHLKRFNRDFANDDNVSFPDPLDELTTSQVLVETFVEGTPILEYTKPDVPTETKKKLALLGLETTLKMIFLNDFVHGDLHPGNILISGKYPDLKMHLLDCGLVLEMGPDQHVNLVKVLGAFTRRNGRLAGELLVDLKSETQAGPEDMELFVQGIEQLCILDADQNFIENVGDYITDICFMACKHRVKLEGAFVNASMAVEIMEGIAGALDPSMAVAKVALPLIVKAELMHAIGFK